MPETTSDCERAAGKLDDTNKGLVWRLRELAVDVRKVVGKKKISTGTMKTAAISNQLKAAD